jgi:hypothetical protein
VSCSINMLPTVTTLFPPLCPYKNRISIYNIAYVSIVSTYIRLVSIFVIFFCAYMHTFYGNSGNKYKNSVIGGILHGNKGGNIMQFVTIFHSLRWIP